MRRDAENTGVGRFRKLFFPCPDFCHEFAYRFLPVGTVLEDETEDWQKVRCLSPGLLDRGRFAPLQDVRPGGAAPADRRGALAAVGEPRGRVFPFAGFLGFGIEVEYLVGLECALFGLGPFAVALAFALKAALVLALQIFGSDWLALHFAPRFQKGLRSAWK